MNGPSPTGEILLGKYRVDPMIGPHPAGTLRAGLDLRFERPVRLVLARHPLEARQLHREAQRLGRLRHPHLAPLQDHGLLPDGQAALVFPEPAGQPLAFWLPEAPEGSALEALDQLLRALARLHAAGVSHGGIRPELIRVEDRPTGPHATLGEVGLSQLLAAELTLEAAFRPPEALAPSPGGDVFALAACFHRLGAAATPQLGPALARACAEDPEARLSGIPALLAAIGRPAPDLRALTPAPAPVSNVNATALAMPSRPPAALRPLDVTALFTESTPPAALAPVSDGPTVADGVQAKRDPRVRLSAEELAVALDGESPTTPTAAPAGVAEGSITAPTAALPAQPIIAPRPGIWGVVGLAALGLIVASWLWLR